jgi:hypothetical protein
MQTTGGGGACHVDAEDEVLLDEPVAGLGCFLGQQSRHTALYIRFSGMTSSHS